MKLTMLNIQEGKWVRWKSYVSQFVRKIDSKLQIAYQEMLEFVGRLLIQELMEICATICWKVINLGIDISLF